MLIARWLVLLLLGAGLVCLALYLFTGEARYQRLGVRLIKWTVFAGLGFFVVLIVEELTKRV